MKLYTKTICPRCMWMKSELEHSGQQAEIINVDLVEEARERLLDAGFTSVPVLEVNGRFIVDPEEMIEQMGRINDDRLC